MATHPHRVDVARAFVLVIVLAAGSGVGCGDDRDPAGPDAAVNQPDAAPPAPTYAADVQPLLQTHCASCHATGVVGPAGDYPFPASYAETERPSQLCPGESVGRCVGLAVANQAVEGAGCRTFVVTPFHREGWPCLTAPQQAVIAAWIAGGMIED